MEKNLSNCRKNYTKFLLLEGDIKNLSSPIELFDKWFEEAKASEEIEEPNAMTLFTIGSDGGPEGRVVLLKEYSPKGFIFYTNYGSKKAKAIEKNQKVGLSFFWPPTQRQVLVKGKAQKVSQKKATDYFLSRPKESQIAAWVSKQSDFLDSRRKLDALYEEKKKFFETKPIQKPPFWGGYEIVPYEIEFWQGGPNRLHDRIFFKKIKNKWNYKRLYP